MFRPVVIGILLFLIAGAGYYLILDTKNANLGANFGAMKEVTNDLNNTSNIETVSGTYEQSTNDVSRTLNLSTDGSATLTASFANGVETMTESGSWNISKNGAVEINLIEASGTSSETYPKSKIIVMIQSKDNKKLIPFKYDSNYYGKKSEFIFARK